MKNIADSVKEESSKKKTMGLLVTIVIAVLGITLVTGCILYPILTALTPSESVALYLDTYKSSEGDNISPEVNSLDVKGLIISAHFNDDEKRENDSFIDLMFKKSCEFSYVIEEETVNSDTAEVTVQIKYPDIAAVCKNEIRDIAYETERVYRKTMNMDGPEYNAFNTKKVCLDGFMDCIAKAENSKENIFTFGLTKVNHEWIMDDFSSNVELLDALGGGMMTYLLVVENEFDDAFESAVDTAFEEYCTEMEAQWAAESAALAEAQVVSNYSEAAGYVQDYLSYRNSIDHLNRRISNGEFAMLFGVMAGESVEQNTAISDINIKVNGKTISARGWTFTVSDDYTNNMGIVNITENGDIYSTDEFVSGALAGYTYEGNVFY